MMKKLLACGGLGPAWKLMRGKAVETIPLGKKVDPDPAGGKVKNRGQGRGKGDRQVRGFGQLGHDKGARPP